VETLDFSKRKEFFVQISYGEQVASSRGKFDPHARGVHDPVMQKFLQGGEEVTSSGFGALLSMWTKPDKGKIYVTSLRVAIVLDERSSRPIVGRAWNVVGLVHVKKKLMGATASVTLDGGNLFEALGFDSTKSIAVDIEHAWLNSRGVSMPMETTDPQFAEPSGVRCSGCGEKVWPEEPSCAFCLRLFNWPAPLDFLVRAQADPEIFVPSALLPLMHPKGAEDQREEQRKMMIQALTLYSVKAFCSGRAEFVEQITRLVTAVVNRDPISEGSFGDPPDIGLAEGDVQVWKLLCRWPSRLSKHQSPA
jgi:hypothetical protein